ncbi:MAG: DUF1080 domain-containing protein [Pirellulaceae bacterium]
MLDASMALKWVVPESHSDKALALRDDYRSGVHELLAPDILTGAVAHKGIEVQIYASHEKGADAKLTDHDSGGIIPGIPPTKNPSKPAGEWNTFRITSKGRSLTVRLNGEVVNEVDLDNPKIKDRPATGYIGFQDHSLPLALRKIRIRESESTTAQ